MLGIYLDDKLTWNAHTQYLTRKLSKVIYLLYKLRKTVTTKQSISAYYAFFHSHLVYGILLWGNSSGAEMVFKCQKKAIRCMKGVRRTETCRPIFKEYKIMTVPSIYILQCILSIKEKLHECTARGNVHLYNTRCKTDLDVPLVRLKKTQQHFKYVGMKLYNALPELLRNMHMAEFRKTLEKWLICNAIYSVNEFQEKVNKFSM